ncbi:helix-turn-helix domain-containing protein [Nonomuraea sp. NPDC049504]|uniref:helix-turn-helix domain-containing protein n=1 Tax=Nonomuraea sp. NPDC049504 TaxID=3154729 RepID=UPI003436166F
MLPPLRTPALERNDRAPDGGVTVFGESAPFQVGRHRHPVWKVVLPLGGHAWLRPDTGASVTAAGLIVPPEFAHTCGVTSGYVALFIDPTLIRPGLGPVALEPATVRRLHAALSSTLPSTLSSAATDDRAERAANGLPAGPVTRDAAAGFLAGPLALGDAASDFLAELAARTGAPSLDPRVAYAVRRGLLGEAPAVIAADVGLSMPRLRALVRAAVGVPLVRLRRWGRLRVAVSALPGGSVASAAAEAGFADQAHLARTARELLGRTPGSLRKYGCGAGSGGVSCIG